MLVIWDQDICVIYASVDLLPVILTLPLIASIQLVEFRVRSCVVIPALVALVDGGRNREQGKALAKGPMQPPNLSKISDSVKHDPLWRVVSRESVSEGPHDESVIPLLGPQSVSKILKSLSRCVLRRAERTQDI